MPQTVPRPFNVLVVDDEPDVRDLLVEYFEERGHRVAAAADGITAKADLERERFDLVVTDLQLPGVDGLGVLQAARAVNPSTIVIVVTGYASLDTAVQAVRLGAYDYLTKPFSLGQIDVIVRRVSERQALEAENRQVARKFGDREAAEHPGLLGPRLEAIELRLARLEDLLGRVLVERPRF